MVHHLMILLQYSYTTSATNHQNPHNNNPRLLNTCTPNSLVMAADSSKILASIYIHTTNTEILPADWRPQYGRHQEWSWPQACFHVGLPDTMASFFSFSHFLAERPTRLNNRLASVGSAGDRKPLRQDWRRPYP